MPKWFRWLTVWILVALALAGTGLVHVLGRAKDGETIGKLLDSPSFLAALVAGVVALILVVANRYADMGHAEHERRTREVKASIAVATEIRTNLERQRKSLSHEERCKIIAELEKAGAQRPERGRRPSRRAPEKVATVDRTNFVYESLKREILSLPVEVVDAVVEYYNLDDMLNNALRTNMEAAHGIEVSRMLKFYDSLFELTQKNDEAAIRALSAIWFSLPKPMRPTIEARDVKNAGPEIALADRLVGVAWVPHPSPCERPKGSDDGSGHDRPDRASVEGNDGAAHENLPPQEEEMTIPSSKTS